MMLVDGWMDGRMNEFISMDGRNVCWCGVLGDEKN